MPGDHLEQLAQCCVTSVAETASLNQSHLKYYAPYQPSYLLLPIQVCYNAIHCIMDFKNEENFLFYCAVITVVSYLLSTVATKWHGDN
jgi:hypothetical protein